MSKQPGINRSLCRIAEWPFDLNDPVFGEYSLFKLGVLSSVRHYTELLVPMAQSIMSNYPGCTEWVLTSPPVARLPKAANRLCWDVYNSLLSQNNETRKLSVTDLFLTVHIVENLEANLDYSKYTLDQRSAAYAEEQCLINNDNFRNKGVIFIDDINVTGTTQGHMRALLEKAEPASINWLYIIDCDEAVGRNAPKLESVVNESGNFSIEDMGAILSRADIRYTHKCISKILSYNDDELEYLFGLIESGRRMELLGTMKEVMHGETDSETIFKMMEMYGV